MSNIEVAAIVDLESAQFAVSPDILPYSNNSQRKTIGFSWGDASPLLVAEVRGTIIRCEIAIIESFNAVSSVSVGTEPSYSDLFPVITGLTLQEVGVYEVHPLIEFTLIKRVFLLIFPGIGCSAGSGILTIDWSDL